MADIALEDRIEGSVLPDTTLTITVDGAVPSWLTGATWTVKGSATVGGTVLWTKSTGLTASSTGVTAAWTTSDLGTLTGTDSGTTYILEFDATSSGSKLFKQRCRINITTKSP